MNAEIGTEAPIFLFWEYLFQIFGILSLQCVEKYKYINLSQTCEFRNWETEHYNSVLEMMRLHSELSGNT